MTQRQNCGGKWRAAKGLVQNPLNKEYTLNHNIKPPIIEGSIPYLRGIGLSGEGVITGGFRK